MAGRENPVDRILDHELNERGKALLSPCDDATFARRASLDLIGLLPDQESLAAFLEDRSPGKRTKWVERLLAQDVEYAEHWLTFWNDLLRNDYGGTGFITNGRKQISQWLYRSLVDNKPFDVFTRELISPSGDDSRGYIDGIRWRGEVSAGQTVEIQFAQSVGQSFLGINMKCASCHDSFVDRWKLDDAYGLAAIYAAKPMEVFRCDKPTGKTAQAAWLFPELGNVDPAAPPAKRLEQLASLMTHPENGRFTRTIVNRLWQRLMGRGIVHPLDAMQSEPWNADLLDYLAVKFAEDRYDLKACLRLIATSNAYQSVAEVVTDSQEPSEYVYAGPRAKRLTAEQFVDCVWQLTGASPKKLDAPVRRGKFTGELSEAKPLSAEWIWGDSMENGTSPAGEVLRFHKVVDLRSVPKASAIVLTCDNEFWLYINGQEVLQDTDWQSVEAISLSRYLKSGKNSIDIIAKNGGNAPNAAGLFAFLKWTNNDGTDQALGTDASWEFVTSKVVEKKGKLPDWKAEATKGAKVIPGLAVWKAQVDGQAPSLVEETLRGDARMVRAGLLKSDFLMRSLGRPNRDQIVSMRPAELSTLEAIDLANGETLASWLQQGAQNVIREERRTEVVFERWMWQALSRRPSPLEMNAAIRALGKHLTRETPKIFFGQSSCCPSFNWCVKQTSHVW